MTRAADLAKLIAGGGTITVADNSDTLTLESTDADANIGPVLNLHRNSASPADNDLVGRIVFKADDDAGNAATFARIETTATDVSNGSEDGRLDFFTAKDDTFTAALSIKGTNVGIGTTSDPSHGTADNNVLAIGGKQNNGSGVLAFIDTAGNSDALLTGDNGSLTINVDSSNATADSTLQIRVDNTERFKMLDGGQIDATCLYAHTTEYSGSMDDLKRTGFYRSNNGNTNNPTYAYYAVIVYGNQSNVTSQIATVLGGTTTYVRSFNTSWSSWARLDT